MTETLSVKLRDTGMGQWVEDAHGVAFVRADLLAAAEARIAELERENEALKFDLDNAHDRVEELEAALRQAIEECDAVLRWH